MFKTHKTFLNKIFYLFNGFEIKKHKILKDKCLHKVTVYEDY